MVQNVVEVEVAAPGALVSLFVCFSFGPLSPSLSYEKLSLVAPHYTALGRRVGCRAALALARSRGAACRWMLQRCEGSVVRC